MASGGSPGILGCLPVSEPLPQDVAFAAAAIQGSEIVVRLHGKGKRDADYMRRLVDVMTGECKSQILLHKSSGGKQCMGVRLQTQLSHDTAQLPVLRQGYGAQEEECDLKVVSNFLY